MAGARLTAFARAVTTHESFDDIVAPAIADLQHEAGRRRGASWSGYLAVWTTIARAGVHDFRVDAASTLDRHTTRRLLTVSGCILLALVVVPRLWAIAEIGFDRQAEMIFSIASIPVAVAMTLPALMLPVAAVISGRRHGRTVVLLAAATTLVVVLLQAAVIPAVQRTWTVAAMRAVLGAQLDATPAARETAEDYVRSQITGQPFGPVFLDEPYSERRDVGRAHALASLGGAFAFALCGAAMRLRRDWTIVALTLPIYGAYVWLVSFSLIWMSGLGFSPVLRGVLPTAAVFAFGAAALTTRAALDRTRRFSTVQP